MKHAQCNFLLFILALGFSLPSMAALLCQKTHSQENYQTTAALMRPAYWAMPRHGKEKTLKDIFEKNKVPVNLVVEGSVRMDQASALTRNTLRTILEDMNDRVGFFYENQVRVQILRDLNGESWAFLIEKKIDSLRAQPVAIYSMEIRDGRKTPELVIQMGNRAIL